MILQIRLEMKFFCGDFSGALSTNNSQSTDEEYSRDEACDSYLIVSRIRMMVIEAFLIYHSFFGFYLYLYMKRKTRTRISFWYFAQSILFYIFDIANSNKSTEVRIVLGIT